MKYMSESSKSARYEKIHEAVEKTIHNLAEKYIQDHGTHRIEDDHGQIREYDLTEDKLDEEAYNEACDTFMKSIEDAIGNEEIYWIFEIMLADSFGYIPNKENPYAVRKPTVSVGISVLGFPYFTTKKEQKK